MKLEHYNADAITTKSITDWLRNEIKICMDDIKRFKTEDPRADVLDKNHQILAYNKLLREITGEDYV